MDGPPQGSHPGGRDPGWPAPSIRSVLAALVPGMLGRDADDPTEPPIVPLRRTFLGFVIAPVLIAAVLVAVVTVPGSVDERPLVWGLLAAGAVAAIAGTGAARRRRIVCADAPGLTRQVHALTLLSVATADSSALAGFVAAFLADALWPYLLGLLPTAYGLARTAPTHRRIRELDRRLEVVGCGRSVSDALYSVPDDPDEPGPSHGPAPPAG